MSRMLSIIVFDNNTLYVGRGPSRTIGSLTLVPDANISYIIPGVAHHHGDGQIPDPPEFPPNPTDGCFGHRWMRDTDDGDRTRLTRGRLSCRSRRCCCCRCRCSLLTRGRPRYVRHTGAGLKGKLKNGRRTKDNDDERGVEQLLEKKNECSGRGKKKVSVMSDIYGYVRLAEPVSAVRSIPALLRLITVIGYQWLRWALPSIVYKPWLSSLPLKTLYKITEIVKIY